MAGHQLPREIDMAVMMVVVIALRVMVGRIERVFGCYR